MEEDRFDAIFKEIKSLAEDPRRSISAENETNLLERQLTDELKETEYPETAKQIMLQVAKVKELTAIRFLMAGDYNESVKNFAEAIRIRSDTLQQDIKPADAIELLEYVFQQFEKREKRLPTKK